MSPDGSKVYVANDSVGPGGISTVSVIATATNTSTTVPLPSGSIYPADFGIMPDGSKVYVADIGAGNAGTTVTVLDGTSNAVLKTLTVGSGPIAIGVSPDGTKAYTVNYNATTMSVINTVNARSPWPAPSSVWAVVTLPSRPTGQRRM